jgi:hypothetical protein
LYNLIVTLNHSYKAFHARLNHSMPQVQTPVSPDLRGVERSLYSIMLCCKTRVKLEWRYARDWPSTLHVDSRGHVVTLRAAQVTSFHGALAVHRGSDEVTLNRAEVMNFHAMFWKSRRSTVLSEVTKWRGWRGLQSQAKPKPRLWPLHKIYLHMHSRA